jgi:hypothetical protein
MFGAVPPGFACRGSLDRILPFVAPNHATSLNTDFWTMKRSLQVSLGVLRQVKVVLCSVPSGQQRITHRHCGGIAVE